MRKCVKMIITDYHDIDAFYKVLKKRAHMDNIEGVAEPISEEELQIIVHGPKDEVDDFVCAVEDAVSAVADQSNQDSGFMVEPFIKEEDYRGVFRFIKKS
jgi:acylphosphatase